MTAVSIAPPRECQGLALLRRDHDHLAVDLKDDLQGIGKKIDALTLALEELRREARGTQSEILRELTTRDGRINQVERALERLETRLYAYAGGVVALGGLMQFAATLWGKWPR